MDNDCTEVLIGQKHGALECVTKHQTRRFRMQWLLGAKIHPNAVESAAYAQELGTIRMMQDDGI